MSQWSDNSVKESMEVISKRAAQDAEFRQLCFDNPGEAVKEATGKTLPEGFTLRFVDNAGADLTLVLPDLEAPDGELDEAELENVAGGLAGHKRTEHPAVLNARALADGYTVKNY